MLPKPFTLTIPMQDKYTVQIDTLLSSLALNAVAPMPANTILGNASSVVAAPTALTIANLQDMLGLASTYVPYTGATKAVNLGGQALTTGAITSTGSIGIPAGSGLVYSGDTTRIISPEDNVSGALISTPGILTVKTGASRTTYLIVGSTGAITMPGTVTTGTLTASGIITANVALSYINAVSTTGTNAAFFKATNTGGNGYFGIENSAGGYLASGTTAYNTVICSTGNYGMQFATDNTVRMTIANTGAISMPGTVSTGAIISTGSIEVPAGSGLVYSGDTTRIISPEDNVSGALISTPGILTVKTGASRTTYLKVGSTGTISMPYYGAGAATFDASGNITSVSDETLKNIQGSFSYGLDAIKKIRPIMYKWKIETGFETETAYPGFSAQNVQSAVPEAVIPNKDGILGLQDRGILAALVNSVQELDRRITALELVRRRNETT